MDKLIGISGAHGAGKTTVLKELERRGYTVDPFKVSRHVQQERGWTSLEQALSSFETMYQFQIDILKAKRDHDLKLKTEGHGGFIFTERTFLDIYAYASYWTWEFHDPLFGYKLRNNPISFEQATKFLMWFRNECELAQLEIYLGVCLLPRMDHIPAEADPHRAGLRVSTVSIFETMDAFARAINTPKIQIPIHQITELAVADRADGVEQFLRTL
jgi:hypothetical protein